MKRMHRKKLSLAVAQAVDVLGEHLLARVAIGLPAQRGGQRRPAALYEFKKHRPAELRKFFR